MAAAAVIFAAGAATTYLWRPAAPGQTARGSALPTAMTQAAPAGSTAASVIQIAPELMERSGITVESAGTTTLAGALRLPCSVQPNAYRKVIVTPLVAGRVTRVPVELGQTVARGTTIAEIYSPDVAAARAAYLAARADTAAGDAKLRRTERLAALGSASQQELEEVRAEHVRHEAEGREAAARLRLLGFDPSTIDTAGQHADSAGSTLRVVAPQAGVVLERPATVGMSVEPSTVLVAIGALSPVWIIADAYDRDVAGISEGAQASVSAEAYPGLDLRGRVAYIAPDVRPETRTTEVRVEVPNPEGKLRFGMFVTVAITARGTAPVVTVPRSAVQTIGAASVVFVPEGPTGNAFRERQVTLGAAVGDRVIVVNGLSPGDKVVTRGSFVLRAEAERLGIRPPPVVDRQGSAAAASPRPQVFLVAVTTQGFEPATLTLAAGAPARVTFMRKTDETCAKEVVFPDFGIRRALPLNQPVVVDFTPRKGVASFQCGMGMLFGKLVVR
jgi:cobalt-zinc-cadmium efflux system membrane fusion protein